MPKHFENLVTQLDKLARHNRQGSFRTRQRRIGGLDRTWSVPEFNRMLMCALAANRLYAQDVGSDRPMPFHGLRHTRAAEWYVEFVKQGQTPYQARKAVSKLLGHGRDDVTRIYLASLDKGDGADGK